MRNELPLPADPAGGDAEDDGDDYERQKHAQRPDDGEHRHDGDDDPRDRRDETKDDLEENVRGDDQDRDREQLARCVRNRLSHVPT